jgi:hypothetical protein
MTKEFKLILEVGTNGFECHAFITSGRDYEILMMGLTAAKKYMDACCETTEADEMESWNRYYGV